METKVVNKNESSNPDIIQSVCNNPDSVFIIHNVGDKIIGNEVLRHIRNMFSTKEAYEHHMRVLFFYRNMYGNRIMDMDKTDPNYNIEYPLFGTLNEIIGCLLAADDKNVLNLQKYF